MNLLSEAALSAGTRGVVAASLEHLRRPRRAGGDQSRRLNLPPAARVKSLPGARSWLDHKELPATGRDLPAP